MDIAFGDAEYSRSEWLILSDCHGEIGSFLLPLDGAGRLGTDIQRDAVATSDFVDDTTGDGAEHLIVHAGPVGGHSVDTLHDA